MRLAAESRRCFVGVAAVTLLAGGPCFAQEEPPTYGRIAGDLSLVAGAGAVIAARGPRIAGEVRVRYLEMAGLFATYEDGAIVASKAEPRRVVVGGLEIRPLFLLRWLKGLEIGQARLDLAIDSFGIDLGAVLLQPQGSSFATQAGLEFGVGLEFPILPSATGPWIELRGGLRWGQHAFATGAVQGADDRSVYLALAVAWHQTVLVHAIDVGDLPPP